MGKIVTDFEAHFFFSSYKNLDWDPDLHQHENWDPDIHQNVLDPSHWTSLQISLINSRGYHFLNLLRM